MPIFSRFALLLGLVAGVGAMLGPAVAVAEEIRLQLKGGGFEMTGELKSFDGKRYLIVSPVFGQLTIETERFDCISPNCPTAPVALQPPAGVASGQVAIAGSNTIGNALMPALIEAYAEAAGLQATKVVGANPLDMDVKLKSRDGRDVATAKLARHGSSTAFDALEKGVAEIGMSSRRIKTDEVQRLRAAGLGDMTAPTHEHIIGLDGLTIIVGPDNPAVSISIENAAKVFSGQITDWAEVGLPPGPITVYAPQDANGTFETFNLLVLAPRKLKLTATAKRTENHAEQSDWVAADPLGIGFVGVAYQRNAKSLNIEAACGLITRPTKFSMKTEEYPLSRRLYLYTAGTPKTPLARSLLEFALSEKAQPVVAAADFIDQKPETLNFRDQGARIAYALNAQTEDFDLASMRTLITDISKAERLSTTLRFEIGSSNLDNKAQQDIRLLASLMQTPAYKGRELMLLGFADAIGSYEANLRLSVQRSRAVEGALRAAGFGGALVKGYSELAPVACNDTPEQRNFNRRVEVWLR
ncbi:MAG: phosphate ABC transporter substrate-binding/OmpA family protein [Hyphomicrobiaceae bacterium]|nr:phosphate ABC transporter substrate-binding/OmpA family protein [Hyphomicrobiaceae bacterium]